MKRNDIVAAAFALGIASAFSPALADESVSAAEAEKIQAELKAWGCEGGDMEKETSGPVHYEVDDAICADGEFDIKLNADFRVLLISRH